MWGGGGCWEVVFDGCGLWVCVVGGGWMGYVVFVEFVCVFDDCWFYFVGLVDDVGWVCELFKGVVV